jgi:hypothetical protein
VATAATATADCWVLRTGAAADWLREQRLLLKELRTHGELKKVLLLARQVVLDVTGDCQVVVGGGNGSNGSNGGGGAQGDDIVAAVEVGR